MAMHGLAYEGREVATAQAAAAEGVPFVSGMNMHIYDCVDSVWATPSLHDQSHFNSTPCQHGIHSLVYHQVVLWQLIKCFTWVNCTCGG